MVAVAPLAAIAGALPPTQTITATCRRTKSAAQRRQLIQVIVGPAVDDDDVLALDIGGVFEALAKCAQAFREPVRRYAAEEPDDRHRRLLRARRQRPRGRAAEQRFLAPGYKDKRQALIYPHSSSRQRTLQDLGPVFRSKT
jgi:hypothetical protein